MAQAMAMPEIIGKITTGLSCYNDDPNAGALIENAYRLAAAYYRDARTAYGGLLIDHCAETALTLTQYLVDTTTLASGLLREAVPTGIPPDEIERQTNPEVRVMTALLAHIAELSFRSEDDQTEALRRMFIAMARDVRVIMIEIVSRYVFLSHADSAPADLRESYAQETLDVFSPIASRMGVSKIASEIDDLCFRILYPSEYARLSRLALEGKQKREEAIHRVSSLLKDIFRERGMQVNISGRTKHLYSTYGKMIRRNKDFNELYDLAAIRIITTSEEECYRALSVLHTIWEPVAEEFDDYISVPKSNGYKSIHTVVIAPNGQPVEIQIRTWDMHQMAQYGVAAHWQYKESVSHQAQPQKPADNISTWIRGLARDNSAPGEPQTPQSFKPIMNDAIEDKIYTLSPKGRVIPLSANATPIDFAYNIHTEVGHQCKGAKVNGRIVTLDYRLHNGDVVEIITQKNTGPSRDWLRIATSPHARTKIRQWFRKAGRDENIAHGRSMLQREMERAGLRRRDLIEKIDFSEILETFNYKTQDDIYAAIGCGDITIEGVIGRLRRLYRQLLNDETAREIVTRSQRTKNKTNRRDIIADGIPDLMTTCAKCCLPVPGDLITGYVTRTRGIAVHRKDCPNIQEAINSGQRLVPLSWAATEGNLYRSIIDINTLDSSDILNTILASLSESKINVVEIKRRNLQNSTALLTIKIEVSGIQQIIQLLSRLSRHPEVLTAQRRL